MPEKTPPTPPPESTDPQGPEPSPATADTDAGAKVKAGGKSPARAAKKRPAARKKSAQRPPAPQSEPAQEEPGRAASRKQSTGVPIVGIGASAGGLEAFEQFFTHVPDDSGMAFVVAQHVDPTHTSILAELISRYTRMKVCEATDNLPVKANCVYVMPPNRDMAILHGRLHLIEPTAPSGLRLPIDYFFRSLAQDQGERATCVVLSGTGSDGTLGLRAVKGEGGMAMVQDPESARYDGMPRSAIATGLADYVLPPREMPEQVLAYVRQTFRRGTRKAVPPSPDPETADYLGKILVLLRAHTGHDFYHYKASTVERSIQRRMAVNQIEGLPHYMRLLQHSPGETETLFKELLIGVTHFFRDPDAFQALREKVIPALVKERHSDVPVRVWVPACSTGEEAYSIALLFLEYATEAKADFRVQIFATDIDSHAIEVARNGVYPDSIAADVPQATLRRFFTKEGNTYQVNKSVRGALVFAEQSVIKDPPFSKLDLVSCRNLLIYMQPELQRKALPVFHYALKPGGYLFLGPAEGVGTLTDLFTLVDRRWKIYRSIGDLTRSARVLPFAMSPHEPPAAPAKRDPRGAAKVNLREAIEGTLLDLYMRVSILVNEKCEVLYIHGRAGRYLEPTIGEANLNLLEMAREGLRMELTTAIRKATTEKVKVHRKHLLVRGDGADYPINLTVMPVSESSSLCGLLLVVIEAEEIETQEVPADQKAPRRVRGGERWIEELEHELRSTKEYLRTTIDALETSNADLTSTNAEMQSSNEELQSTNEELETSKEELQSVNEELVTVNTELGTKLDELSKTSNDLVNLLVSTNIGTVFLDLDRRIRRFTPPAAEILNLIESDRGRPIAHIVSNLEDDHWKDGIGTVLDTLTPISSEVRTKDGHWYAMRIRPYRTTENTIDGVVITFSDIDPQKQAQGELRKLSRVVEQSPSTILITDPQGVIEYVNPTFSETTGYSTREALGKNASLLASGEHSAEFYREMWQTLNEGHEWHGMFRNRRKDGELYWDEAAISPVYGEDGSITHFVSTQTEITGRNGLEDAMGSKRLHRWTLGDHSDVVFITNEDGDFVFVYPSSAPIFGFTEQEVLAMKNIRALLGERLFDASELRQRGAIHGVERRITTKDGEERTLLVDVKRTDGHAGMTLYSCRDVTA